MPTSFNHAIIEEFRANGGKVGGPFEGGDLLLLTTTGAKSGTEHTAPLGYVRDGDLLLVVGSAGGAPRHPAWYHNLLAHPSVQVEIGTEMFEAIAVPAEGARRDRLFERVVRAAPGYADYQTRTTRTLPVVVLERAESEEGETPHEVRNLADKLVEVHTWLRSQLRHVHAETEAHFAARAAHQGPGEPPAPGLGLQIRQHCLAFCQFLEFHHTSEDVHLFPGIAAHHPHLSGTFDRLREEHRTVARIQGELVALLADISTADPLRFRAELARMSDELTTHLDYEEESLLPVLAEIPWPPAPPIPDAAESTTP
ncbi:nitroreductase family deazaflavin-dependent oxidoreductase [Streptomyces lunaelactis]|uniref:nitroreductase/quinone reductase family protein n=1 Tax=Streptomyces lunaelactis TaxID=1535768 RepID=UPI0015856A3B|nr:nitroreductase/quinone reductase family protein [Streptomyces lunaelactis]NUK26725.1 nitroreductase family deazaflavin-dependent oxidoreductase [Streptomyces lunaelactis]NUK50073.1 nitroreductase family deazaflavin-dependent oxidoreductase [Streptomyces lunaelactis]NUK57143.1 nitroreductase family deazaflavin-dependent oxidoreductase [Streptomyces lunaelactis]NUK64303.1 nitroreductase family deazaflavin-dependent oxidoreductase [Streptomyces lunaelactis]NUK77929.1 nitroreductase family deaz